jgi:tetratricopeptide (TPR) repeat protein
VRAAREAKKGNCRESIKHLDNAIRIDASYMEAHNNLGIRYVLRGEYERGAGQFETALRLDAISVFALTNLGLARFLLKQFPEAEAAARAALRLDGNFAKAHYILWPDSRR